VPKYINDDFFCIYPQIPHIQNLQFLTGFKQPIRRSSRKANIFSILGDLPLPSEKWRLNKNWYVLDEFGLGFLAQRAGARFFISRSLQILYKNKLINLIRIKVQLYFSWNVVWNFFRLIETQRIGTEDQDLDSRVRSLVSGRTCS